MKVKISYFYKVRFLKPNEIPVSTALTDPKWYHANKSQSYTYRDKRGVINGLRASVFAPGRLCEGLCCGPTACKAAAPDCRFLQMYHVQLKHIDFEEIMQALTVLAAEYNGDTIVLLVHEAPDNPCSERSMIIKWFEENGYELKEYDENVSD